MESFFDWLYLAIGFAVGSLGFAILKDARGAGDGDLAWCFSSPASSSAFMV